MILFELFSFISCATARNKLVVLVFHIVLYKWVQEIEFMKKGSFSPEELDALVSVLQLAAPTKTLEQRRGEIARLPSNDKSVASLEAMGVKIYGLNVPNVGLAKNETSWDNIAGYSQQKRYVEY